MNILVLNGSPRKNGNVESALKKEVERFSKKHTGCSITCMSCRSNKDCILKNDDAHKIAEEIKNCDILFTGTPVYWGNMNGKLKSLFDRLVGILMAESKTGIPKPLHKGKKAVIVTSCTTPFPFNYICGQSTGAVKAVKEILKSSGFKIIRKVNISNTKNKEASK